MSCYFEFAWVVTLFGLGFVGWLLLCLPVFVGGFTGWVLLFYCLLLLLIWVWFSWSTLV